MSLTAYDNLILDFYEQGFELSAPSWFREILENVDIYISCLLNTLRLRQNDHHLTDDILNCIFFNENIWTLIKTSLKFVPKCVINNIPSFVQIMAWRRPADKPLSKPIVVSSLTHICITQPHWINTLEFWPHIYTGPWLGHHSACRCPNTWWC